ncbi:hypothetical protein Q8F55_002252 [Vanrija albida]|uniref:RRM domain-containing protein n=1 Tax=Vanrija albida TaxID=181172 RepID=A0ABR3QA43_9TREE
MDFSSSTAQVSRETWAPRSPIQDDDRRYAERPPAPHDVEMREGRGGDRDDRDDRDRRGDDRRDDRRPPRDDRRDGGRDDRPPPRGDFGARPSAPPSRPNNAPNVEANPVLGVFGLSIRTYERDLEDEFSRHGDVEKVTIVYDQRTDRSRGFGFITMRSVEDAARCIEKLNGVVLHGRAIRVDYSATTKPHAPTPGEYRGEKRPFDDRFDGRRRDDRRFGGDRYDDRRGDRYGGGDRGGRFGDRYGPRDDDRRGGFDRDRPFDRRDAPRRDDDPYGGRSRRDDDRPPPERRRSPSPRRRYSASPDRRGPPAGGQGEPDRF